MVVVTGVLDFSQCIHPDWASPALGVLLPTSRPGLLGFEPTASFRGCGRETPIGEKSPWALRDGLALAGRGLRIFPGGHLDECSRRPRLVDPGHHRPRCRRGAPVRLFRWFAVRLGIRCSSPQTMEETVSNPSNPNPQPQPNPNPPQPDRPNPNDPNKPAGQGTAHDASVKVDES